MMNKLCPLAIALAFILGSFSAAYAYTDIIPQDAYFMLNPENHDYNLSAYLVDVRTPAEWQSLGHPVENVAGTGAFLDKP